MDRILQTELNISRKHIQATSDPSRYLLIVHKSWLKALVVQGRMTPFVEYVNLEDWPKLSPESCWANIYISIHQKLLHKVIPLQRCREIEAELPLTYSQVIHQIAQTNHRNLWKAAHQKYSGALPKLGGGGEKRIESGSVNLITYEAALREVIVRTFGCRVIRLDRPGGASGGDQGSSDESHVNLYSAAVALESADHFFVLHSGYVEYTLLDCVSYSPAVLNNYNKSLFIIYQLLKLIDYLHKRDLSLGPIALSDIYLTENLLLRVMPRLAVNLIPFEEDRSAPDVAQPSLPRELNPAYSLQDYCDAWCHGQLSNFDYLTILNEMAGRRRGCPGNHHIMPWVTDFTARNGMTWRDLTKSKYRLNKGDIQLDITFQPSNANIPHHVSDVLSDITYYVYMARRIPKSTLCKHVRPVWVPGEYPASIQRLYEWTPDECIPEFFTDPTVFKSLHEDLPDLKVPSWSSCPEDFVNKHREALESQTVSEKLHHWIDLTFGYKLSGSAAVKSKNVLLPLVDEHQDLCKRGIVQLFFCHHPPRQFSNAWTGKVPPRIRSRSESRKRLTRSSEDVSTSNESPDSAAVTLRPSTGPRNVLKPHQSESIERSISYYVHSPPWIPIALPKNFNPIAQLNAVETLETFKVRAFHGEQSQLAPSTAAAPTRRSARKTFKQLAVDTRARDLQTLAVIVVELFLATKMRVHGACAGTTWERRLEACRALLRKEPRALPACVAYPVRLLLLGDATHAITDKGLAWPTAEQLLEPMLSNSLFPFPTHYTKLHALVKTVADFSAVAQILDLSTFFECDGTQCSRFEALDKARIAFGRKTAECKVKACAVLMEDLLETSGTEVFPVVHLLLPYVIDMVRSDETSILATWYLFDLISNALGPRDTQKFLMEPILQLYEGDKDTKMSVTQNNSISIRFTTNHNFRCKKAVKLYHHSFVNKLIVSFGLQAFLENFVTPLIEAVGGYKDPEQNAPYHVHEKAPIDSLRTSRSTRNLKFAASEADRSDSNTLMSLNNSDSEKTLSETVVETEEMFKFEPDDPEAQSTFRRLLDDIDTRSDTGSFDLPLNIATAIEVTGDDQVYERISNSEVESGGGSPTAAAGAAANAAHNTPNDVRSPTIPIPSAFRQSIELNAINCEVGSKKSIESMDMAAATPAESAPAPTGGEKSERTTESSTYTSRSSDSRGTRSSRISDLSSDTLKWLSHRLGPVLTARSLSRNLLKMLTLCYVGQENLVPEEGAAAGSTSEGNALHAFTVSGATVAGDRAAANVLECLTSIAELYGDQFIQLQYFPHASELIALCKRRLSPSLEGGLIASLALLKYLIPCLSDARLMDQLQDIILRSILHPIIRMLGSSRVAMPSGYLARNVLARKMIDTLYALAVRIGPEMTREHLCVPALQRFFLIFDKVHGDGGGASTLDAEDLNQSAGVDHASSSSSLDEPNYLEIQRDGGVREWYVHGSQIRVARRNEDIFDAVTPPPPVANASTESAELRERALEEIRDVFTPQLASTAYMPFLRLLGDAAMRRTLKNLSTVLSLCLEHEPVDYASMKSDRAKLESTKLGEDDDEAEETSMAAATGTSFGSNVAIVGNRIDVQGGYETGLLDLVAYKLEDTDAGRHLRGNWLAYWEHEIGRSDKDTRFNLKQMKLQAFGGHTGSVRAIMPLDNENSFMSGAKDKTVKLWSLRSVGDGSAVTSARFTYTNHKKSILSLAFLEAARMAVSCDSGVHVWDPFVGSQVGYFDAARYSPVTVVRTFPAPSRIVIAGTADSTVRLIDSRTMSYVNEWKLALSPAGAVRCMTIGPSGTWIAAGLGSGQIILLDARTGLVLRSWRASDSELLQLAATSDSELLSSTLDHSLAVWNARDGAPLFHLKPPPEPAHCLLKADSELLVGTPANRIGCYSSVSAEAAYSFTKLRSEIFRGVMTSMALLPLNRMLLLGGENGNISALC